jgi:hypothetical protein
MGDANGHRWVQAVTRRPRWTAAILAGVAVAAFGVVAIGKTPLPTVAPIDPNDAIQISVVQPVEPEISPGDTMDVGDLVDGYTHVARRQTVTEMDDYEAPYADAWLEDKPRPAPQRGWREAADEAVMTSAPREVEVAETRNPYGFDRPEPDYEAERRARYERREQMREDNWRERRERRREDRWRERGERMRAEGWREVPSGARLSSDTAFY